MGSRVHIAVHHETHHNMSCLSDAGKSIVNETDAAVVELCRSVATVDGKVWVVDGVGVQDGRVGPARPVSSRRHDGDA